uniref:Uncharacterized protein n=1 Tax=Arundo donax TaxID=35708 RepID=A0A0A9A2P9_ARUDO
MPIEVLWRKKFPKNNLTRSRTL